MLCPRKCGADRLHGNKGWCRAPLQPKTARAALHFWEEPCISGTAGSGAVFFSNCNLACAFCQNYKISHEGFGKEISIEDLSDIFIDLQNQGALNINLVSATQYIPQVAEAIILAKSKGLSIPVVYNSNAYETVGALRLLEGLVDIYLPDLKYADDKYAVLYSSAPNYFTNACAAILEMHRQVGSPVFDENGVIKKGLIVRHLILPGLKEDSKRILLWIRENLPDDVHISLMSQYTPVYKANEIKQLNRRLTTMEYNKVIDYFFEIGLKNGFMQERSSADCEFTPDFDLTGIN